MIEALLGLDIGTTSTKAVLFDREGREHARAASAPYRSHSPHPGWVEQDPEEIWQAVLAVIREVLAQAGETLHVLGMSMAAQSGSLQPAGKDGEPVYPLITWMDGRTEELVRRWRRDGFQEWVKPLSGWTLYPGLCLPTIAWLQQHAPETFAAAETFFSLNDFLVHRLTGLKVTNPSNAGGMQLVDIHTGAWGAELCELAGISVSRLSDLQPSGSVIGRIRPEISRMLGLPEETLLINGGHDQGCTALGLGITDPGSLLLACGTAWVFTGVTRTPDRTAIPDALDLNFHVLPDRWTMSQSLGGLGASLEWWVGQAWQGERAARFAALDRELAATSPNGSLVFLPLTGGHENPATTRAGGFVGLRLGDSRAQMARAVLESAGYELAWALEAVTGADMPVQSLSMVGGAANSPAWPSILADITAVSFRKPACDSWPALGAAVLAGLGTGLYQDVSEALGYFRKESERIKPDPEASGFYARAIGRYKAAVEQAQELPAS